MPTGLAKPQTFEGNFNENVPEIEWKVRERQTTKLLEVVILLSPCEIWHWWENYEVP